MFLKFYNKKCWKDCKYYQQAIKYFRNQQSDYLYKDTLLKTLAHLCNENWYISKIINKNNIEIIVAMRYTLDDRNMEMALFTMGIDVAKPIKEMYLYAEAVYFLDSRYIEYFKLVDILGEPTVGYNNGYGSILLNEFINYVKRKNVCKITGFMSYVDIDHWERLEHFYEKFGFCITPVNDYQKGIELILNKNI